MSNSNHPVCITPFTEMADNTAKSIETTWGDFAQSLIGGHPIISDDKTRLPLFNGWRYKRVSDPSVNNGTHSNGTPIKLFSSTHVRRHSANLEDLSMLVLDFDGLLRITEVKTRFDQYEYVCYTSLNHRSKGFDKFRVVLPFAYPMQVSDYRRLVSTIRHWLEIDHSQVVDDATYTIGQIFILPAVRAENEMHAQSWLNEGNLLDWAMIDSLSLATTNNHGLEHRTSGSKPVSLLLRPDDILNTANGDIRVRDIDRKVSNVLCPFHADKKPREFAAVSKAGIPYLVCHRCGTIYMDRPNADPIIAGIANIQGKKSARGKEVR